jgi:5-methylcytosine-specific restriction endonuclease McrA
MSKKKDIRANFRREVYTRDKYMCRKCNYCPTGQPITTPTDFKPISLDAHHITDRNEMPNGGYVKENGISLCSECHEIAEMYHQIGMTEEGFYPVDLYKIIGSSYELAHQKSLEL